MLSDTDTPIVICLGSVENGPDVLAAGTGTLNVGRGKGVVSQAKNNSSILYECL